MNFSDYDTIVSGKNVENLPIDYYWGCGQDASAKNKLGMILMEVRQQLR